MNLTPTASGRADVPLKTCPACGDAWQNRTDFLADPGIVLAGYQVSFRQLELGLLTFNHQACRGSMSLHAAAFADLYDGPVFRERATGGPDCLGYCLLRDNFDPCPTKCECAWVREVLQIIRAWPKAAAG